MNHSAHEDDSTTRPWEVPQLGFQSPSMRSRFQSVKCRVLACLADVHSCTPCIRTVPVPAILIILLLAFANLLVWAICAFILIGRPKFISTAVLSYTLGLRHALDADHISAIDLMTRRLIVSGQRPVTVGTFFSLGHSTIVVITSIAVAATAVGFSKRFDNFSTVGGIIGTAVSAAFLILLGLMNGYILYRLVIQLRRILYLPRSQQEKEAWKLEGSNGILFRVLKRLFKIIDRPWKMYPLGVLFGLGFDTSSEVALLGISSIEAEKGTSIWLIMIFPVLFTAGMCLVDTIDGALMLTLYVKPMEKFGETENLVDGVVRERDVAEGEDLRGAEHDVNPVNCDPESRQFSSPSRRDDISGLEEVGDGNRRAKDPLAFLYYSIVLISMTILVALVIGIIQLLTLVLNVANPKGRFWNGVATVGDYYDVIGGAICGSFLVVGGLSVICHGPWRKWIEKRRLKKSLEQEQERLTKDRVGEGASSSQLAIEEGEDDERVCAVESNDPRTTVKVIGVSDSSLKTHDDTKRKNLDPHTSQE